MVNVNVKKIRYYLIMSFILAIKSIVNKIFILKVKSITNERLEGASE